MLLVHSPAQSNSAPDSSQDTAKRSGQSNPLEIEYEKLVADDDAAQADADRWIQEAKDFQAAGAGGSRETLVARIEQRFDRVKKSYEAFVRRHPNHARARLAYGSFLNERQDENGAVQQWEKARQIEPTNPAAWNNLANHFGHRGEVKKAFGFYERAIKLNPSEPVYLQNLATTTYLFRKDAKEHYGIKEDQVFNRALELYRKAVKLDPDNFPLATDYAQSYYGIKPLRVADALKAWNYALKVANDQIERDGVYIHLARIKLLSGRFDEARQHLDRVTNEMYQTLKSRLAKNIIEKETKIAPESVRDHK